MRLADIFVLLRARWRLAAVVWVAVLALVAAATFLKSPKYTASAAVVLDVKADPIGGGGLAGVTNLAYIGTQLGILRSDRVALRVVKALGWDQDEERRAAWQAASEGQGDFNTWLAGGLLKDLEALPVRDSNVITVSYTSKDAEFAAQVVNAWVQAYVATTLELRVDPARQYSGFFDTYGKQLREDLEKAQARLSSYQREHALVATDERLDVENVRLMELSSQMVALQGLANESGGRQSQAVGNADRMPEVLANPVIVSLTSELSRQEATKKELGARLGDQHPAMIELQAKIAELRSSIAAETKRVTGSIAVSNSVTQGRLAQARAAVDEQRNKVLHLKALRDEAGVLERDVENAKRAYDMVMTRASQTNVESNVTQTNVNVLKQAVTPLTPSEPRVAMNMAIGFVAATLLALATALATEMRDRRLRTEQDVLRSLRLPVLGVLPERSGATRRAPRLRARWTAQIANSTPPPGKAG